MSNPAADNSTQIILQRFLDVHKGAGRACDALRAKNINLLPSHMLTLTLDEEAACVVWAEGNLTDQALQNFYPKAWKMIQEEGHKSHYTPPRPIGQRVF